MGIERTKFNDISSKSEEVRTLRAFENKGNKDVKSVVKLSTINEKYEGDTYPGTDVSYHRVRYRLNGVTKEGVFPKFEYKYQTFMPKSMWLQNDTVQFKDCTRNLKRALHNNPELRKEFNKRQLEQIENEEPRISGVTWHHNERPGCMQLVDAKLHSMCKHTGGRSGWGGGSEAR